jgi:TPR repeat protein
VDVYSTPDYLLILPEEADLAAKDIEKKVQVHGVAEIAKGISLEDIAVDVPDNPEMVTAKYQGGFRIFHTDVTCNGKEYHLIAYAEDLRWLELDKIVETLLRNDLDELNGAIVEASDEDWYATRLDHLLQPLKHVVASEINFELVKATFDPEYQGKFDVVVSADYRAEASKGVLGSLRCIYNRLAKQFWWKALLASIVIELAAWSFGRDYWAGLLGLICVPLSWVLFTRRVRAVLTDALGNRTQADKAMTITSKGKERKAIAFAAVCAPCALVAIAMWISLPSHGPWSGAFGGKASSASPMPIEPLETAKRTSNPMADVTANGRSSPAQLAQIRQALEARANSGDVQAYGPYARAVLDNTGLSTPLPPKVRFSEAKKWAELALQSRADDVEALTVKGLILVMGLGVTENQSEGLSLLTRAANEGGTHAMHVLGMCRFGVHYCDRSATNYSEARKWFSKAAAKDSPEDIYNLGLMDWNGYGIPKPNRQSAMLLWKKAAAMGEERALRAVSQGRPPN